MPCVFAANHREQVAIRHLLAIKNIAICTRRSWSAGNIHHEFVVMQDVS